MAKPKKDNFLADAVQAREPILSYRDGFRFGFGFFIAGLVVSLLVGGLAWAIVALFSIK